ncbi:MAG: Hsp70 family protein [Alphaproteobacteria bacterium]
MKKTVEPCKKAMADAGVKPSEISEVILVGGMDPYAESSGKS